MDLSKRATAWVTAAIKENEFLHDITGVMSDYMDVEDTKFAVHLAMKFVPKLVGLVSPELGEALELIDDAIDLAQLGDLVDSIVDNAIEFVALTLDDSGPPEGSMERELMDILYATLEDRPELSFEEADIAMVAVEEITAIEEVAVEELAVLEELASDLEILVSDEQQQDIEALQNEFEQDMKDRMETIDKMEDKYFKNHPDLTKDERTEAEGRFEEIRTEEKTNLETELTVRMAELRTPEQEPREDPEPKRKEQERS